ncbi:MAG TPA: MFS transporter [Polyangia bacterium]
MRSPCDEAELARWECDPRVAAAAKPWVLAVAILGSSLAFVDGTAVNVALPRLQTIFGVSLATAQWIALAYALGLAALLLVGGALGDRFGRRRVFGIGVVGFALASAGCGLARSVTGLIAWRAAQGVGAALLVPGSLALLSASFPESERGRAIGTWAGVSGISAAIGPVLGGWIVQRWSWRWIFFINLPLAAAAVLILRRRVPECRAAVARPRLDLAGALLTLVGLGGLTFGLLEAPLWGWGYPVVVVALAAGGLALAGFVVVEARSPAPLVPLALFRSRDFAGANLVTLLLYAALNGALFFVPFDLIQVQGYAPAAAGAALLPFVVIMFGLSRWAGGLVTRHGARLPLVVGPLVSALGFLALARPAIGGTYWMTFFPALVLLGLGMVVTVAPLTTTVMGAVPRDHAGVAAGINNAVSRVAALIAVAVLGLVMQAGFARHLAPRLAARGAPAAVARAVLRQRARLAAAELPPLPDARLRAASRAAIDESFVDGFRAVMLVAAALAALSAASAALLVSGRLPAPQERRDRAAGRPAEAGA